MVRCLAASLASAHSCQQQRPPTAVTSEMPQAGAAGRSFGSRCESQWCLWTNRNPSSLVGGFLILVFHGESALSLLPFPAVRAVSSRALGLLRLDLHSAWKCFSVTVVATCVCSMWVSTQSAEPLHWGDRLPRCCAVGPCSESVSCACVDHGGSPRRCFGPFVQSSPALYSS